MPVDIEIRGVAMHPFPNVIRHPADGQDIACPVESESVGSRSGGNRRGLSRETGASRASSV